MTEDDPAAEKRTAVECLTLGAKTAKRVTWKTWEFVVGLHQIRITKVVDSPTADTCPTGDPRCDGPGGAGVECFGGYRPEGSA